MTPAQLRVSQAFTVLTIALGLLYFAIHFSEWRGRQDVVHHDQYNYIDVASHLFSGDGLVQSALGFNQPRGVKRYGSFPSPFEAQPPLFPLLIAAGAALPGGSIWQSALILPSLAHLVLCVLSFLIGRQLRDSQTGLVAGALTLLSLEARQLGSSPYSETTGMMFFAAAFALLLHMVQRGPRANFAFLAGLLAGLSVATRYVLLAFVAFGGLALLFLAWRNRRVPWPAIAFGVGASLVIFPILLHNLGAIGSLLPQPFPSDRPLWRNMLDTVQALEFYALIAVVLVLFGFLSGAIRRGTVRAFMRASLLSRGAWLIWAWVAFFLVFVLFQRTTTHFNNINLRFLFPVTLLITVMFAVFVMDALFKHLPWMAGIFAAGLCFISLAQYLGTSNRRTPLTLEGVRANHKELLWLAGNSTARDLIVGVDAPRVPLFLDRKYVISVASFPYNEILDHTTLTNFLRARCAQLDRALIYIEHKVFIEAVDAQREFGEFLVDLHRQDLVQYPNVRWLARDELFSYFVLDACPR